MCPAQALDLQRLAEAAAGLFRGPWGPVIRAVAVLTGLAVLAGLAARWVRHRRLRAPKPEVPSPIDVGCLPELGPPAQGPYLLFCGTSVRLAAVVLAPPGLARDLPPINRLAEVFDALVPGLAEVIRTHRPVYRRWPPQVSTQGFVHRFFAETRLTAPPGTETPWCLVAGRFVFEQQPLLVGLVMRAGSPARLGRRIVEDPPEWPRLLSVQPHPNPSG